MSDLIRVSTVLKLLFPCSLDFIAQADLDRGSRLHASMEIYINDRLNGYIKSFVDYGERPEAWPMMDWIEKEGFEVESAEERFEDHQLGYCGHVDLTGRWKGVASVADFKFAESLTDQNAIQMEAYRHLTKRRPVLLQCPKTGIVKARRCKPNSGYWAAFLSGLNVLKFRQSHQPFQLTPEQIETIKRETLEILCKTEN